MTIYNVCTIIWLTHKVSPQIREVMEFPKRLNVKQLLEKLIWKLGCIALFGPLKQIVLDLNNFCRFVNL
jgi:hypothetical protein